MISLLIGSPCWVCWQNIVYLYQPCCVAKNQGIIDHTTIILYLFDVFYRNTKFLFSTFHVVFSHPIHSHPGFHCVTHTHSRVEGFVYAPAPLTHNVIITPSKKHRESNKYAVSVHPHRLAGHQCV